ncbi:hypothetical protein I7I53_07465 [Histoplasma capsulatum var. duboisii H88]|uniref:Uncharacterized protein n=1 Tax=Ajellomyces capsulatus (strain H88) TaxID=544711 RepID=A0A8A1LJ20_AJEC8|nr:hypothetical protein I7I53_07465 [Histoplasma capsulatum var. duboisii H88]
MKKYNIRFLIESFIGQYVLRTSRQNLIEEREHDKYFLACSYKGGKNAVDLIMFDVDKLSTLRFSD